MKGALKTVRKRNHKQKKQRLKRARRDQQPSIQLGSIAHFTISVRSSELAQESRKRSTGESMIPRPLYSMRSEAFPVPWPLSLTGTLDCPHIAPRPPPFAPRTTPHMLSPHS